MRLNGIYRRIARCTLGDGSPITFWEDLWLDSVLAVQYPRLFAKNKTISVHGMMLEEDLSEVFMPPPCLHRPMMSCCTFRTAWFSYSMMTPR